MEAISVECPMCASPAGGGWPGTAATVKSDSSPVSVRSGGERRQGWVKRGREEGRTKNVKAEEGAKFVVNE